MSTQPTDAMIEAGIDACREEGVQADEHYEPGIVKAIYLAMQSARTPPPCAGDDVERVARAICETHGYDPEAPAGEHLVQWECFRESARAAIAALGTTPSIVAEQPARKRPGEFTGQAYRENL